jgi:tetratricopeptide (TPR) repeat protein
MSSRKRISRNDPCPCGSGKKYKKCCLNKTHSSTASPGGELHNRRGATPAAPSQQMYADAMMLRNSGQFEAAKKKYEDILRAWPKEARAIAGLGSCLISLGQRERGLEEVRRAVKSDPDDLISINELTVILFNLGKVEESLKWAKRAVKMGPQGAKTYAMVANCYEKLHRIEEALAANRLAQNANPQNKYLKLQEAKLIARNGDYERAQTILRETTRAPGLQPELKRQVFGELGRVLDKLERYDLAYEAFVQSGLEASRTPKAQRFKLEHRPAFINAYVKGLTEERLNKWKPEDLKDDSWTPAFLVGFPRSGTTMTEQILAAHSGIITTDEQPYLDHAIREWARIIGPDPDLGKMVDQLDAEIILKLRKIYREKVEADQEIPIGSKTVIDKFPFNIIDIGFINLIFPEAKIIVALRDPRDCCLSCFTQDFELSSAMLHLLELDRTVNFYTQVMGAWLHFRDIISLSHITVRYEDIVQNLEFEAKRLIDYLGLDWEPDVLQFHQRAAKRVISTPSYVAVTEPVHTRAIGRWKNYHQQFTPLLPILEPFLKEFGYQPET